uniref:Uncharacterized protein n=1 Tax=Anguilla anguilla TaxID=7936 RepID=A0A0E9RR36_ANGAN
MATTKLEYFIFHKDNRKVSRNDKICKMGLVIQYLSERDSEEPEGCEGTAP